MRNVDRRRKDVRLRIQLMRAVNARLNAAATEKNGDNRGQRNKQNATSDCSRVSQTRPQ